MKAQVDAVRSFNRFYTRRIGVLHESLLASPFSLTEVRVLWELAHREKTTATELGKELGLDAGYLSRILRNFRQQGFLAVETSKDDARRSLLSLTKEGLEAFAPLDARSHNEVAAFLAPLSGIERKELVDSLRRIQDLIDTRAPKSAPVTLRAHRPGDMGWVVQRHGALYFEEYGWNEEFEALVAEIVAKFIRDFDPKAERCWIAERDGQAVGSVFLVKHSKSVAKLRLLLVEPSARGCGVGAKLVDECIRFARKAGYRKLTLWTNDVLTDARRIYERAGFRLTEEEPHRSFGHDLVAQTWELKLAPL